MWHTWARKFLTWLLATGARWFQMFWWANKNTLPITGARSIGSMKGILHQILLDPSIETWNFHEFSIWPLRNTLRKDAEFFNHVPWWKKPTYYGTGHPSLRDWLSSVILALSRQSVNSNQRLMSISAHPYRPFISYSHWNIHYNIYNHLYIYNIYNHV